MLKNRLVKDKPAPSYSTNRKTSPEYAKSRNKVRLLDICHQHHAVVTGLLSTAWVQY
jgi:hypothetical protein